MNWRDLECQTINPCICNSLYRHIFLINHYCCCCCCIGRPFLHFYLQTLALSPYNALAQYTSYRLLISCSPPHSMTKFLEVSSSLSHSRQSTARNLASIWVSTLVPYWNNRTEPYSLLYVPSSPMLLLFPLRSCVVLLSMFLLHLFLSKVV